MRRRKSLMQLFPMKLRPMLLWVLVVGAGIWIITFLYTFIFDSCQGYGFTAALCKEFDGGTVSGSLCPELCRQRTLKLSSCGADHNGYRIFYWNDIVLKVQLLHLTLLSNGHSLSKVYEEPAEGTRMEQFRDRVSTFVRTKLGDGDHSALVTRIVNTADVNNDAKVTLAEAKTIWALLQHNEFFLLLAFQEDEKVPALRGFCGDLYAVDYIPHQYLYWKDPQSFIGRLFPKSYTWGFPVWQKRAKIAMGLLEFTMDSLQHDSGGEYYFCKASERNIGYTDKYDVRLLDVTHILPKQGLISYLSTGQCSVDSDCEYTPHCATVCDASTRHCTEELLQPNLVLVCQILEPYLAPGAPQEVGTELTTILHRCSHLGRKTENLQLETSLVLNDFKSLLWKQIIDEE